MILPIIRSIPMEMGVNMFFWLIAGVALGYFFKPQIDGIVKKATKFLKDNRKDKDDQWRDK